MGLGSRISTSTEKSFRFRPSYQHRGTPKTAARHFDPRQDESFHWQKKNDRLVFSSGIYRRNRSGSVSKLGDSLSASGRYGLLMKQQNFAPAARISRVAPL
jgi:hypothetical protein